MAFYYSWPLPDSRPVINKGRLITTTTMRDAFAAHPTGKTRSPVTKWHLLVSRAGRFECTCIVCQLSDVMYGSCDALERRHITVSKCLINLLPDRIYLNVVIKCDSRGGSADKTYALPSTSHKTETIEWNLTHFARRETHLGIHYRCLIDLKKTS